MLLTFGRSINLVALRRGSLSYGCRRNQLKCAPNMLAQSKFAPGLIRIAYILKGGDGAARPLTFDEGWKCIVFELHNIANSKHMHRLLAAAKSGRISREEFTWEGAKLEYEAMNKTVTFFKDVWKPWAERSVHRWMLRLGKLNNTRNPTKNG